MTRPVAAFAIAFFGIVQQAHAFCEPGTVEACFLNGQFGTRTCGDNAQFGPCILPNQEPLPAGQCFPKYRILTVIYAPPGRASGTPSSVVYANQSSLGTTTSSTRSFRSSHTIETKASLNFIFKASAGLSFGYARNTVDSKAIDIRKADTTTINRPGPASDGINHDQDQIWLWLGPTLDVSMPNPTTVEWTFNNNALMDIQFVFVGHLKNPALMPPGVRSRLEAYGITTADYPEILKADPFAFGAAAVDGNRYNQINMTFPYEPPFAPNDPPTTTSFSTTYTVTNTSSTAVSNEYRVGLSYSVGLNVGIFKDSLDIQNSWTWTDTRSRSTAIGSTETATVNVTGPSFGYAGPTDIAVYYDVIYKTFMFAPYTGPAAPTVRGVIISDSDAPVAGKEVAIVADGVTYRSITNAAGEFRIYGPPRSAAMKLRVAGSEMSLARSAEPVVIEVP